ncbi:MAG: hypothetical protein OSB02_11020 [Rhodospirillaceae bacterium]|nr:hypothetical protein [Rhodospirillaceae bacterium]
MVSIKFAALLVLLAKSWLQLALVQLTRDTVQVRSNQVGDGTYMFIGAVGNIAISTDNDGVLI